MEDEKQLIQQAQQGNPVAFEQLIAEHQKRIFSIAYRIAGNSDDAADMAQEVLVKIFKNINKFKGDSKFSTWIYRVATNTCLDELKRIRRHPSYSLDQEIDTEEGSISAEIEDDAPTPEESAERKAVRDAVNIAIARLGDDHKKVIVLRDLQGFSYEEIAKIMNCSEGTVKSRISRARSQLKKILQQDRELFADYFVK
ncbi:RNA polymerase sigma factor [Ructibacterium gallinarum]|uniref:Sigma-70 family RNA polymerase sigma factor n=1 Tax=Ructibacterium gallinarum TaxID=2779355 RepID=A0A9D5M4C1_9FIRM|nr:sigma-70 family RNA polymerase sigma factor [Ructibacterium gallinarum]MBE5040370.1 sigma-70 family RNA polymerase sigma factor [Ructibacterium gallinarum]